MCTAACIVRKIINIAIFMIQLMHQLNAQIQLHYYKIEPSQSQLNLLSWVYLQEDCARQDARFATLAVGYKSGALMQIVREVPDLESVGDAAINAEVLSASSFSYDASQHAFGDGNVLVVRRLCYDGWKEIVRLAGHLDVISATSFSSDGTRIVSGDTQGMIKIWRYQNETWCKEHSFFVDYHAIHSVAFLTDTKVIFVQKNGLVSIWNLGEFGTFSLESCFRTEQVAIAYCPINNLFAFGYDDGFGILYKMSNEGAILSMQQIFKLVQKEKALFFAQHNQGLLL